MSEKKKPAAADEFDTNAVLKPFKGCVELESVLLTQGVVASGGDLKRLHGVAASPNARLFLRDIAGVKVVTHVDPGASRGMAMNIPMSNIAGFVLKADRQARDAEIERAAREAQEAVAKAHEEQRQAMLAQEARNRGEHEKGAEA